MKSHDAPERIASVREDADLVSSYLQGDLQAFDRIYRKHGPRLVVAASMMGAGRGEAVDVVHEVFAIAMVRLWQIENPEALTAWLYRIMRNETYRRTRDRRSLTSLLDRESEVNDIPAPIDPHTEAATAIADEIAAVLRRSVAGLENRDRDLFASVVRERLLGRSQTYGASDSTRRMMTSRMRDRLKASQAALLVALHGRDSCTGLRRLLPDWDGEYDPILRKRITRHIESCSTCRDTRHRLASTPRRYPDGPR
ncbi:MAG: sigma factor [Ilumatobacteraceae bacterium]